MRPAETIPGMGGGRDKGEWWRGEFNYDNIVRTFVNVTKYPQYNNNMVIKINLENQVLGMVTHACNPST
jgi:hypothetical protein